MRALSALRRQRGDLALICWIAGVILCAVSDSVFLCYVPLPKLKMVTAGNSAGDLGEQRICVNNITEQNIVHCTSLYSRFSLRSNC